MGSLGNRHLAGLPAFPTQAALAATGSGLVITAYAAGVKVCIFSGGRCGDAADGVGDVGFGIKAPAAGPLSAVTDRTEI